MGMSAIAPMNTLNLCTWKQIETRVCGEPDIDVNKLRGKAIYEGYTKEGRVIITFWEVLTEMTPNERCMFLRFVWGRSKLPASGDYKNFKISKL